MSEILEGIAGIKEIIRRMQDPEECDPGQIPQLDHLVNVLAELVMGLGNAILQTREIKRELEENIDQGWFATAASMVLVRLSGGMPGVDGPGLIAHLETISRAMAGKVRLDLGNLDESETLGEINRRRGFESSKS